MSKKVSIIMLESAALSGFAAAKGERLEVEAGLAKKLISSNLADSIPVEKQTANSKTKSAKR